MNARMRMTLNLAEASAVLGIPIATAYRLIDEGTYPVPLKKAGRRWIIPLHPLAEFLGTSPCEVLRAVEGFRPTGNHLVAIPRGAPAEVS